MIMPLPRSNNEVGVALLRIDPFLNNNQVGFALISIDPFLNNNQVGFALISIDPFHKLLLMVKHYL